MSIETVHNEEHSSAYVPGKWGRLMARIQAGDDDAIAELYKIFDRGTRYLMCRQLQPQDLDDRVHDAFLIVIGAIQREEIREPERLMGFVRTVVRRQIAAYIHEIVAARKHGELVDVGNGHDLVDLAENPEEQMRQSEKAILVKRALASVSERDREILTRFYLFEEPIEQICREMSLTDNQFRLYKWRAKEKLAEFGQRKLQPQENTLRLRLAGALFNARRQHQQS